MHITKKIIYESTIWFRKGHSTSYQLRRVVNHVKSEIKKKKRSTGMLAFDIEKAFDSVWHNALLYKLSKLKYPNYIIRLIQSFLKMRRFFVTVGNSKSPTKAIPAGVPQVNVLSPILFNILTSDLSEILDVTGSALFADDKAIYCSGTNPNKITQSLLRCSTTLFEIENQTKCYKDPSNIFYQRKI